MAELKYYNYPGVGEQQQKNFRYSQAVRIDDKIECSGQGGWSPEGPTSNMTTDINAQVDQAFKNVDLALKTAGGKGWSQVYKVRSYHVPINNKALAAMTRNFKQWMPDHQPLYTCIGVTRLGEDDMRVEIEVEAYDPEGAKKQEQDVDSTTNPNTA